jgi:hypothetical protein
MRRVSRSYFLLLAGLSLGLLAGVHGVSAADDKKGKDNDAKFDRVSIPTFDGMELSGTFYPAVEKNKDAVVLCLHDFSHRKGGGSHGEWDHLAAKLQKEGYAVLTFDFRGFGGSKSVSPDFWKSPYNRGLKGFKGGVKSAESIDQKDFPASYYSFLVNDIAAARAFLDRKNDSRELNTSNLIVIGAGQGATLGALWAAAEMHRQRDATPPMLIPPAVPLRMDDPEGKDIGACIWLTISPNLEGKPMSGAVKSALVEVARDNKVPSVLVFGENDANASNLATNYKNAIEGGKKSELKNTGTKTVKRTDLAGSALLGEKLDATPFIIKHLNAVMDDRGNKEWRKRDEEKSRYFWSLSRGQTIPAKLPGEKLSRPIPPALLRLGSP